MKKGTSDISVKRVEGPGCKVSLTFQFDPDEVGEAGSKTIWDAFGQLVASLLITKKQRAEFMRQFKAAAREGGIKLAKTKC